MSRLTVNIATMRTLARLSFSLALTLGAPGILGANLFTGAYMSVGPESAAGTRKPGQIQVLVSEKESGKFYRITFFEGYKEPRTIADVYECPFPNSFDIVGEQWKKNNTAALCQAVGRVVFFYSERGMPLGRPMGSRIARSNYFAPTGSRTTAFVKVPHPVPTPNLEALAAVDRAEWMEEVQLADGEIVVVNRVAVRDAQAAPSSRKGVLRRWEIVFPDGAARWTGDGSIVPLSIEMLRGIPYLAVNIRSRNLCAKYRDPEGSLVFFRWGGVDWSQIPRTEYPTSGRVNLLRDPWGRSSKEDVTGLIRNHEKRLKPGNRLIDTPLDEVLTGRSTDACYLYKNK